MKKTYLKESGFWLIFALLNFLLFVPAYLAHQEFSHFFPFQIFQEKSFVQIAKGILYNRPNRDIFRWSIEFSLLFFGAVAVWKRSSRHSRLQIWTSLFFVFYLALLLYQIYHQVFYKLYQTPPFFYNDLGLMKVGWAIFINDLNALTALYCILGLAGMALLFWAIRFLVKRAVSLSFSKLSYGLMAWVLLESMVFLFRWGYKNWPEHALQFQVAPIITNIRESMEARQKMAEMDMDAIIAHHPYDTFKLDPAPNIFFLFVESYGRIFYDNPQLTTQYADYLPVLEQQLQDSAWYASSVLSRAPVSGGASWVSYATFLDGFDFQNRGTYWALLQDSTFYQYQHLPRMLQGKGYRNYRLSAIGGSEDMDIPWDNYARFYAVDEWIKYTDFDYRGLLYGWGPSPPDQYSLHFANDYIRKKQGKEPFTLFFITQNSHNPFVSPEGIAENWRSLNDTTVNQETESRIFEQPVLENYALAIKYQMEYLLDFVVKEGREEDIFIIVGDHQPPIFPKPGAGFETPLHIIARDSALVAGFLENNFSPGLLIPDPSKSIKHEGFYSLFMYQLLRHYSSGSQTIPPYRPNGLKY